MNSRSWIKFVVIIVSVAISTLRASASAALNVTGKEDYWCWITSTDGLLLGVLWDIPGFIILCIDLSLYIAIYLRLKKLRNQSLNLSKRRSNSFKFIGRISSILLVYLVCWYVLYLRLFSCERICFPIDDILHTVAPKYTLYSQILASFLSPLQGFLNGLVYGITLYSKQLQCFCQRAQEEVEEIESTQFAETIAPA